MNEPPAGPILVIEREPRAGEAIAVQLLADGFAVDVARTAEHARVLARSAPPAIALLGELDAPNAAVELLREIRRGQEQESSPWDRRTPAIVLSRRAGELDLLRAFAAGADDFIVSPASYLELRARIEAILRRARGGAPRSDVIEAGPLALDMRSRQARVEERQLQLRRLEFELLAQLAREPERVFPKHELLRAVWGYRSDGCTRTVDSHASRLRRKLAAEHEARWIPSVRGVGYRLR